MTWSILGVANNNNTSIGVGFGTAALGGNSYEIVTLALQAGFRTFDTAEANWWYDQPNVGRALKDAFYDPSSSSSSSSSSSPCGSNNLEISTKIPPWRLTSIDDMRTHAANSRNELLGFCEDVEIVVSSNDPKSSNGDTTTTTTTTTTIPYPLDAYYIHAPKCWQGWHPACDGVGFDDTLYLQDSWMGMEAIQGIDHTAKRIGLSNVHADELLHIIKFVQRRIQEGQLHPPPRIPDLVQIYSDPLNPALEIREICEQYGIEFVSYSTLGTQHRKATKNPVLTSPIVQRLAEKHSRSVAEVVLSWALQNNMSVIPRSTNPKHILELARLLDPSQAKFLDESDLAAIDSMSGMDLSEL